MCELAEYPRKIVYRSETQHAGNLRKRVLFLRDQFLRALDFQRIEVMYDALLHLAPKNFLKSTA